MVTLKKYKRERPVEKEDKKITVRKVREFKDKFEWCQKPLIKGDNPEVVMMVKMTKKKGKVNGKITNIKVGGKDVSGFGVEV